jgi:hypothetical protein
MDEMIKRFTQILAMEEAVHAPEIVITADTVEDFFRANGRRLRRDGSRPERPFEMNGNGDKAYYRWDGVQPGGKGTPRGTLFVMDAGDVRLAVVAF